MIRILGTVFAGLLGLAFGSFLNVCLSRWPEGESVVSPRSHCRNCDHTLAWWENLPLVSWVGLGGRCRKCGSWIGWRYPLAELAVGALWANQAWRWLSVILDPNIASMDLFGHFNYLNELYFAIGMLIFYWVLVALAILDAENLWLPDAITIPGIVLGFAFNVLYRVVSSQQSNDLSASANSAMAWSIGGYLVAIVAAALLILLIRWIYWLIRRREGIGLGDAKVMALLAAWLGFPQTLLAFFIGIVLGAVVALVQLAIPDRRDHSGRWGLTKLPLATFLCIGGIVSALWGQPIIAVYLRWSGF